MPGPPQQERSPDLGSVRAARRQILAVASRRGLRDVRVFGSVARGEAVETSDVDLLVAPVRTPRCSTSVVFRLTLRRSSGVMWTWPRRVALAWQPDG